MIRCDLACQQCDVLRVRKIIQLAASACSRNCSEVWQRMGTGDSHGFCILEGLS